MNTGRGGGRTGTKRKRESGGPAAAYAFLVCNAGALLAPKEYCLGSEMLSTVASYHVTGIQKEEDLDSIITNMCLRGSIRGWDTFVGSPRQEGMNTSIDVASGSQTK